MSDDGTGPAVTEDIDEWLLDPDSAEHGRRPKKVAAACLKILHSREGKDAYWIDNHFSEQRGNSYDCPEDSIWDDDESLIPEHIISEIEVAPGFGFLECSACDYQYNLWSSLLEIVEAEFGYRAFAAMNLESHLKDWPDEINSISLEEFEDLQAVRRAIRQYEEHQRWEANQKK